LEFRKPGEIRARRTPHLTSVQQLITDCEDQNHQGISEILKENTYVGCIDSKYAIIQHKTQMFLCNVCLLSKELIYQECLHNFGEFEVIKLKEPCKIMELILFGLELPSSGWTPEDGPKENIAQIITEVLIEKRELLDEYFSIKIDVEAKIHNIPLVLPEFVPFMGAIGTFFLRLGMEVNWEDEKKCFHDIAQEIAEFYSLQYSNDGETEEVKKVSKNREWVIEQVLFPCFKKRFYPPLPSATNGSVVQLADLTRLYKVFERC